jgi:hypothetical protein
MAAASFKGTKLLNACHVYGNEKRYKTKVTNEAQMTIADLANFSVTEMARARKFVTAVT